MARCPTCKSHAPELFCMEHHPTAGNVPVNERRRDCPHKPREEKETEPTPAPVVTPDKWYLATQNDALFIIDKPPSPVPLDYHHSPDDVNVIAALKGSHEEAMANGERIVAAVNAPNHSDCVAVPREVVTDWLNAREACQEFDGDRRSHWEALKTAEDKLADTLAAILERG